MKVVVLGGGLGGLEAARQLKDVTVIDRQREQSFQPLLPLVASGAVSAKEATLDLEDALPDARFVQASVERVDEQAREVVLADGARVPYDYLIVATGADGGRIDPRWAPHVQQLKTVSDAVDMRERVMQAFAQGGPVQLVVVGGGPTGVEIAGSFADLRDELLPRFPKLKPQDVSIVLVHGGDGLLPGFSPAASSYALSTLRDLSVDVRLGARVDDVDAKGITVSGKTLSTQHIFWAAGARGTARTFGLDATTDKRGKIEVAADLSLPRDKNVFVIGDAAAAKSKGKDVPGVAQAAIQGGRHVAEMISADRAGRPRRDFAYQDKGNAVAIAKGRALVEMPFDVMLKGHAACAVVAGIHALFAPPRASVTATASLFGAAMLLRPREGLVTADNDFTSEGRGSLDPVGSVVEQTRQGAITVTLGSAALANAGDFIAKTLLRTLSPHEIIKGAPAIEHTYSSSIRDVAPKVAYERTKRELRNAFAAGGIEVLPKTASSGRLMLRLGGAPPAWAPIEARFNDATLEINIRTLDGHPLRGTNDFRFKDDGRGGTQLVQQSVCQGSSQLLRVGVFGEQKQEENWREFHAYLWRALTNR